MTNSISSSFPRIDIDDVLNCFNQVLSIARNEMEVRRISPLCIEEKILKQLGETMIGRYEYTLVSGARVDALYGHILIEYEPPGKLSTTSGIAQAKEQIIKYIKDEARVEENYGKYLGIIISDKIAFVRYSRPHKNWTMLGPYSITRETIVKLIEAFRGLRRKPLRVEFLVEDFGPSSILTKRIINVFYEKLVNTKNEKTKMLFEDWMRLFKQASGYSPEKLRELRTLATEYGIEGKLNIDALLFAIQTYYALIMKLLAAEVVYLYGAGKLYQSYISELEDAYIYNGIDGLREKLEDLENGGVFKKFGYENFLEGDYFSWYLNELDEKLGPLIVEIVKKLSSYEPATPHLEVEEARDLLKKLYQNLVPRDVRHSLGEYYTPDWLADLLLNEIGLTLENFEKMSREDVLKPLKIRVLDPACGSGTFLVRYIARLRAYAEKHFIQDEILVDYLLKNVVGYDLNPLAVLSARTNYLLMIADLRKKRNIEIPIYLTDSLMIEKRTTIDGATFVLKTVAGEFQIPITITAGRLLQKVLSEISEALKSKYSADDFKARLKRVVKISENELNILTSFYKKLLKLEEEGKDRIWISIIKNAFAPMLKGRFDYVVGNPPWVNWENLPEEYREISKLLWSQYELIETRGKGLGKVNRDLAMLFLARCFDLYLKPGGKLAFLMPFTIFKTQAGAGFRKFLATKTRIHVIHDLVTTYPFEGAVNRTSAIVVEKVCDDLKNCPDSVKLIDENRKIKHVIWVNKKPVPIDKQLEDVMKIVKRHQAIMTPIIENEPSSQWMQITERLLPHIRKIVGKSQYKAHTGVYVGLNQIYYVKIKEKLPDEKLMITNPPEPGQKKKVKQVENAVVEPNLVYPLIRGRDVKRWHVDFKNRYIIVPHDPKTGRPLEEQVIKMMYPHTYQYFSTFKDELVNRSVHKLWGKENPFYTVYAIGSYTFAPYKVVWKRIAGAITGKAVSFECTVVEPMPIKLPNGEVVSEPKPIVPDDSTILLGFDELGEAYYVCGVLNSTIARTIIASYTYELGQQTHILEHVNVPRYDLKNPVHKQISQLSRRAHEIAKCIYSESKPQYCSQIKEPEKELENIENEIDRLVAKLYDIPENILNEIKLFLKTLSGENETT